MFELTFFHFVILLLAVYRLTSLFVLEEGPFNVFQKFRDFVGVKTEDFAGSTSFFGQVFSCFGCTSVWVAAAVSILYVVLPIITLSLGFILALSAAAMLLYTE